MPCVAGPCVSPVDRLVSPIPSTLSPFLGQQQANASGNDVMELYTKCLVKLAYFRPLLGHSRSGVSFALRFQLLTNSNHFG